MEKKVSNLFKNYMREYQKNTMLMWGYTVRK